MVTSIDIGAADEVPDVWAIITPEDAADLVFVDYEPLDVVGDMEEALEARPIHPEFELNTRGSQRCRRRPRGADVQIPVTPEQIWRILLSGEWRVVFDRHTG